MCFVISPNGAPRRVVLISVPNMRHWMTIYHFILKADWPEMDMGIYDKTHLHVTRKRLTRWCTNAGLEIERWFPVTIRCRNSRGGPGRWTRLRLACSVTGLCFSCSWRVRVKG